MHPARIAELLRPFLFANERSDEACSARSRRESAVLSPTQLQHISTYIDLLLRWNARVNLTAIRDPEEIVTRHFGESIFAARHLFPTPAPESSSDKNYPVPPLPALSSIEGSPVVKTFDSAADLGSGAGFPGIPIKLWAPHLALTLIESNHKKTAFLREVVRALTLTNVNVFPGRAEELLQQRPDPALTSEEHHRPGRTKPKQSKRSRQKPAESDGRPRPDQLAPLPATEAGGRSQSPAPGRFDLVTLRAVERFASILPVAASLLTPGGRLALLIGTSQLDQAQATLSTLAWDPPLPIPYSQSRILLIARQS
jgi:16S rRNA G527 N7-methylase RsmG